MPAIEPSERFVSLTRNPAIIAVRPRESGKEIAARIRAGVKVEPMFVRAA